MGEEAFFALAETVLVVFGLGAFGFFVGPALFDFFAFEGDFVFEGDLPPAAATKFFFSEAAEEAAAAAAPAEAAFLAFAAAVVFLSAALFLAFGEDGFLADFAEAAFSEEEAETAVRLLADFFALDADDACFFFSSAEAAFAAPLAVEEANLKDPDAPLPLVWTREPEATAPLRYFLMKGATFSASTL